LCPESRVRVETEVPEKVQISISPFTRLNISRSSSPSPSTSLDPPTCHSSAEGRLLRSRVLVARTAPPFRNHRVSAPVSRFSHKRSAVWFPS
jgi:hypothetical protein